MIPWSIALVLYAFTPTGSTSHHGVKHADPASDLVAELRAFPASIDGRALSNGFPSPVESHRTRVYAQLLDLGDRALPILIRALGDPDVQMRRNVVLFLDVAAGGWYDRSRARLDIRPALPALIQLLHDRDARARELAAEVVGEIGPDAISAVPALILLVGDSSEGSRNNACSALGRIGPAAKSALPALRAALTDPMPNVRRFAVQAIEKIETR